MTDDAVPSITVGDVDELDNPLLLDVRESDEYEAGHAPEVMFVPLATLPERGHELPSDRPILCICRVGGRSARATAYLRGLGYDAINLEGGMKAWAAFGLDVVRDDGSHGDVI
jgi:rhodanese-related sulfurtransferase